MSLGRARRAAVLAGALGAVAACGAAGAAQGVRGCELRLLEHRSGRELLRLPLDPALPSAEIAFTHSVLGTPVADRYVWRRDEPGRGPWRAHLVEERYVGEGYGLPHAAAPGERLQRDGDGWRLSLDRVVDPLVVRPLPAQGMRVTVPGRAPVLLGTLSTQAIEMRARGCGGRPAMHV